VVALEYYDSFFLQYPAQLAEESRRIMKAVVLAEESAEHAARLLNEACAEHEVQPQVLTLHSDNLRDRQTSARATEALRIGATPATSMVTAAASTSSIAPLRHHAESASHP
jgi:hypothetical protein